MTLIHQEEMIAIQVQEAYRLCKMHMNKYVKISTVDGKKYKGYIAKVDYQNVTLAMPEESRSSHDERFHPWVWLTVPLAFLAGLVVRRRRPYYPMYYPYPPYSGYPSHSPYPSYYPYPPYR